MSTLGKSMSDINLGMIYLAREVLQQDRHLGMANLGITPDVTTTTAPPTALTTQRYIYSALGFAPQHATYLAVHLLLRFTEVIKIYSSQVVS